MGTNVHILCHDCVTHVEVGKLKEVNPHKVRLDRADKVEGFMSRHMGHKVQFATEYFFESYEYEAHEDVLNWVEEDL